MLTSRSINLFLLVLSLFLSACSTQTAPGIHDEIAKQFKPTRTTAKVYLFRNEFVGGTTAIPVMVDGEVIGKTGPQTFFMLELEPGKHVIESDVGESIPLTIFAEEGKTYYVWQKMKRMGMFISGVNMLLVDEEEGQDGVKQCRLIISDQS